MKNLYKRYMFMMFISPVFYLAILLAVLFSSLYFFIGQRFFTAAASTDLRRFFTSIPYIFILVLPLLSSIVKYKEEDLALPFRTIYIPLSSFFALCTASLFILVLSLTVPLSVSFFGDIDFNTTICSYFGLIFYIISICAFTIFIGILIPNNAASFAISALVIAISNSIHLLPVYVSLMRPFASIAKGISFAWHFDSASKGIIDTRDLIFFIALSFAFIFFSSILIEHKRGNNSHALKRISRLALICLILILLDSSLWHKRIDVSKEKRFSVTNYTKALLSEVQNLGEPISITYYLSSKLKDLYPQVRDVDDFLRDYVSQNSSISYTVVDPSGKDLEQKLSNYGIIPRQIQTADDTSLSMTTVYSGIVIDYLGDSEIIPFVLGTQTLEYDLAGRIQHLVRGTERFVQVLVGNGLDFESDYRYVRLWLESQGFSVAQTYLPSERIGTNADDVFTLFTNTPLLVIGTSHFMAEDVQALQSFIQSGGKVFLATSPYTVDVGVNSDWSVVPSEENTFLMLQQFGVYFKEDSITADISNFRLQLDSGDVNTRSEYVNYPLWPVLPQQKNALDGMIMFWPCAIDYDNDVASDLDYVISPLLVTNNSAWQMQKIDGRYITNPFAVPQSAIEQEQKGLFTMSLAIKRKGESNPSLILFGDQYAWNTSLITITASPVSMDIRTFDFLSDSLLSLLGEGNLLPLKNRMLINTSLYKKTLDELVKSRIPVLIFTCGAPILILGILFLFINLKRKKTIL